MELVKSTKKAQVAMALVTEESAKSKAPNEVIKSLTAQDRLEEAEIKLAKSAVPSNVDLIKQFDSKSAKQGKKSETFSLLRCSQTPLLQLKDFIFSTIEKITKEEKEWKKGKKNELLNQEVLKLQALVYL